MFLFQLTLKKRQKVIKTKEEIMKYVKESIMSNEIANQDIENTVKNVKSSGEVMEVVKEMEKLLEVIMQYFMTCLPTRSNI